MSFKNELGQRCKYRVNINIVEFHPPGTNVLKAIKNAQALYGSNDIDFHLKSGYCQQIPGGLEVKLNVLDMECKWNQEQGEQTDLFGLAPVGIANGVFAFFVNQIKTRTGNLNGCAGHKPTRPAVVISKNCTPWTIAHEIGHVLLSPSFRPVHTDDSGNIMYKRSSTFTQSSNPSFNADQVKQIRKSRYLIKS